MKKCSLCHKQLCDIGGVQQYAIDIILKVGHFEFDDVKEMFGRTHFKICNCCWLLSLGIKPINEQVKMER